MNKLLQELQQAHSVTGKLLANLSEAARHYDEKNESKVWLHEIQRILDLLHNDTEAFYDLNEELIADALRGSTDNIEAIINQIFAHHTKFSQMLEELIQQAENQEVLPTNLRADIDNYVESLQHYLSSDEDFLFRNAQKYLSDEKWKEISKSWHHIPETT